MSEDYPGASPVTKSPSGNSDYPGASPVGKTGGENAAEAPYSTDPVRGAYQAVMTGKYSPVPYVNSAVSAVVDTAGKGIAAVTPNKIKDQAVKFADYLKNDDVIASPIYTAGKEAVTEVGEQLEDLESYNSNLSKDLAALKQNSQLLGNVALAKPAYKAGEAAVGAVSPLVKKDVTKENAYILKTLKNAGHSPEEINEILTRAKDHGLTVGEASNNPELLGLERKISGLNKPGGETVRDFVKNRVDPNNNVSVPFKLKSIADPLTKEVDRASKAIGSIVESAPKTPIEMTNIKTSLLSEKRPPGTKVTNTLNRIDGLVEWAKTQGNDFSAWHRVKQEIYNLGKEASDPNAIEKLDKKTISQYYGKINDVLSGKSPGLSADLAETSAKYSRENTAYHQNLSGRTISDVLKTMPTGGTPAQALKHLYNKLSGNAELQEELFQNMPASQRAGMVKFLGAVKDAGRGGVNDVVKSMQQGSPSFPITTRQVLHKAYDKISDLLTRRDYDALGKALTSPDVEQLAKKLGYIKPVPEVKPPLRLTYQPEPPEIVVDRKGGAKFANEAEQSAMNQTRDRMYKLGFSPGILRAQDLNVIREMETKYGQSEIGKFIIEHKNEPILGRMWEAPQTEYSQATVDKMMGKDAMSRLKQLDKETKDLIDSQTRDAWESHQVPLADMIMARRQYARELAEAKGEPVREPAFGKNSLGMSLDEMLKNQ